MTRIKLIALTIFLLKSSFTFSGTEFVCKVRYLQKIYHPPVEPSYYEGNIIGKNPIAGTGSDGYYEDVWSEVYTLKVKFFSGYELNDYYNNNDFDPHAIVALISWNNGGHTFIVIKDWVTNLKIITEAEVKYDQNGNRISYMSGFDNENRFWEFYY